MDQKKIERASKALKKYLESKAETSEKSQLFEQDGDFVYLTVKSKRFFSEGQIAKPQQVALPHSIWKTHEESPRICLFVRDPQRTYKDALLEGKTPITRCVGVSKLKGKFKSFEARRALRNDFQIFLAEEDVISMLPKLLGNTFYGKQATTPLPLRIRKGEESSINTEAIKHRVEKILGSTPIILPASQTTNIRIGTTNHKDSELAANAAKVMDHLTLKNILSVQIRTNNSPSLPVYYAEKCYSDSDIGEHTDDEFETEGMKRKREDARLDELLAEVADEEDIKAYNLEQKRRRKQKSRKTDTDTVEENDAKNEAPEADADANANAEDEE